MKFTDITLVLTAIFTGLMAGLFFAYSVSVTPGLGKLGNKEFLSAMQQINREIQNPLFFGCFFGSLILLGISVFYYKNSTFFTLLAGAFLVYLLGVFLVTIFIHVPLNNKLDHFEIAVAAEMTAAKMRSIFENRWNFWNNVRTISAILSLILVVLACIQKANK